MSIPLRRESSRARLDEPLGALNTRQAAQALLATPSGRRSALPRGAALVRVVSPARSLEEFVETEASCFTGRRLLLRGEFALPPGRPLGFEVLLANGACALRGIGKVVLPGGVEPGHAWGEETARLCVDVELVTPASRVVLSQMLSLSRALGRSVPGAASKNSSSAPSLGALRPLVPPAEREALLKRLRRRNALNSR